MTMYERIENIANSYAETLSDYDRVEKEFIFLLSRVLVDAEVQTPYGCGVATSLSGENLEDVTMTVTCGNDLRRFSVQFATRTSRKTYFIDGEVVAILNKIYDEHDRILVIHKNLEHQAIAEAKEAEKKAEEERKAEIRFQKQKEKAIADFENLATKREKLTSFEDNFYYALGWLAKHIGSVSAALPDYLEDSFVKHFGNISSARIVDSKKRTVNGNSMQWTFGFKATLRKIDDVPAILIPYLSSSGKAIASTSFIWDLIDSYGFQFGNNQDIDKILDHIPADFIDSFKFGFTA